MKNTMVKQRKMTSRRAVAPVIATLLLVAIAVVGGSIIFVFSQGFFSSAQVSGTPSIESLKILGYDARDGASLQLHDGVLTSSATGAPNNGLIAGEQITVYVQNQGVSKATFSEIRFAGTVYNYTSANPLPVFGTGTNDGNFWILTQSPDVTITSTSAEIQPGQQASIVLQLPETIKTGRDAQFKLTTTNGAVFVGTVVAGQQSG